MTDKSSLSPPHLLAAASAQIPAHDSTSKPGTSDLQVRVTVRGRMTASGQWLAASFQIGDTSALAGKRAP
jgi:hypothetical protein